MEMEMDMNMNDDNHYDPLQSRVDAEPVASAVSAEHYQKVLWHLQRTKPWVMRVGILGFLSGGLLALYAIVSVIITVDQSGGYAADGNTFGMAVNLAISAIYILLANRIVGYGRRIGLALQSGRTVHVEKALEAQFRVWKAFGIIAIVIAGLALVILLGGIAVSLIVLIS
jgi:hypothetical protein